MKAFVTRWWRRGKSRGLVTLAAISIVLTLRASPSSATTGPAADNAHTGGSTAAGAAAEVTPKSEAAAAGGRDNAPSAGAGGNGAKAEGGKTTSDSATPKSDAKPAPAPDADQSERPAASPETAPRAALAVELDKMKWQAGGGLARFNVSGIEKPSETAVSVCFSWRYDGETKPTAAPSDICVPATRAARGDGEDSASTTIPFVVRVPLDWIHGISAQNVSTVIPFVPSAWMRVRVASAQQPEKVDETPLILGVTAAGISLCLTALFLIIATMVLSRFAAGIRAPGHNILLRVISQRSGWASLGKFQIILWTAVVGAGAFYVITLNGSLIDISSGTLILLGISGGAAVASQVKTKQELQPKPQSAISPINVAAVIPELRDDGVLLSWNGPTLSASDGAYVVQYKHEDDNEYTTETTTLSSPRVLLPDLESGTYRIRVCVANTAGPGTFSPEVTIVVPPHRPRAPHEVTGPSLVGTSADAVELELPEEGSRYVLQFRPRDSDRGWQAVPAPGGTSLRRRVGGLEAASEYEFRVVDPHSNGKSRPLRLRTSGRLPRWSDLVNQTTQSPEIDVTRLQMLIFTVVSALFVLLNIWKTGTIPAIDSSYLLLMGISNGVYVTAKFAGSDT